jgi:transcriptional regulator with PAS, ATPase and Fis domain
MKRILVCWIGHADLQASLGNPKIGLGPIGQAATTRDFKEIVLLSDHTKKETSKYEKWFKTLTATRISTSYETLSGPTQFGEIYESAVRVVSEAMKRLGEDSQFTFHLSPGTPAMAAVWIILAKTRFPAELIESSVQFGVQTASIPFDISAEFIPDLLRKPDRELERLSAGLPPEAPEFADIIHRCAAMKRVVAKARRVAPRSVPVLIEGESGTGKELLARAIHESSTRRENPFVAVNCGAIPSELIEAELFGHEKGAFTGAQQMRKGYFESAHQGTLFLDEVGELPLAAQVKILRVLQESRVTRLGSTKSIPIDVRIVAATNLSLIEEVTAGRFRADLFYRLAVAVLHIPPLREREGDLGVLIERLLKQINEESREEPGFKHKGISANAKNLLLKHAWPGNVRELINTLTRAAVWSAGSVIDLEDIRSALLPVPSSSKAEDGIFDHLVSEGIDLREIMKTMAIHYLKQGLEETHGNKTKAAALLGFSSYQTLTNWLKKYGLE